MGDEYQTDSASGLAAGSNSIIGVPIFNADTDQLIGTVQHHAALGRPYVVINGRVEFLPGGTYLLGDGRTLVTVNAEGDIVETRTKTNAELGGPSGGGSVAFSSTKEGQVLAHQQEIEQLKEEARLARQNFKFEQAIQFENQIKILEREQSFQARENELTRENQTRQTLIQAALSLVNNISSQREQARQLIGQLIGEDPQKASAFMQGLPRVGRTAAQAFRGTLRNVVNQPMPSVNLNAPLGQLASQVQGLQGVATAGIPTPPMGLTGLAHGGYVKRPRKRLAGMNRGGVVDMERNPDGVFRAVDGSAPPATAVLVGENPDGTINETTEVLIQRPDRTEIVPLRGRAQQGATIEQPSPLASIAPLSPLFNAIGFGGAPIMTSGVGGQNVLTPMIVSESNQAFPMPAAGLSQEILTGLGVKPKLIFDPAGNAFFVVNQGELQFAGTGLQGAKQLLDAGLDPTQAVSMPLSEIQEFGFESAGGPFGVNPFSGSMPVVSPEQAKGGPLPGPILSPVAFDPDTLEPTSFVALPDPGKIVRTFQNLDPDTQRLVANAYALSDEMSTEGFLARMALFSLAGTAQASQAARFG